MAAAAAPSATSRAPLLGAARVPARAPSPPSAPAPCASRADDRFSTHLRVHGGRRAVAAAAAAAPSDAAAPPDVAAPSDTAPAAPKWWDAHEELPNLVSATSLDELLGLLAGAGDKLVVVDFFATWCRACRGVFPKVVAMASTNPCVLFIKCDFDANKDVARAMGVKALPTFQLFRGPEGRLDSFTAGPSKAGVLLAAVERHSGERCVLGVEGGVAAAGAPELAAMRAARGE